MNSIFNFMFTEKYSALSVPLSHARYPTAKPKNYQQNVTVGGGFNSISEKFRNGPELTI